MTISDVQKSSCQDIEELLNIHRWGEEDSAFWTGTIHYQPWKDVAAFFRGEKGDPHPGLVQYRRLQISTTR